MVLNTVFYCAESQTEVRPLQRNGSDPFRPQEVALKPLQANPYNIGTVYRTQGKILKQIIRVALCIMSDGYVKGQFLKRSSTNPIINQKELHRGYGNGDKKSKMLNNKIKGEKKVRVCST